MSTLSDSTSTPEVTADTALCNSPPPPASALDMDKSFSSPMSNPIPNSMATFCFASELPKYKAQIFSAIRADVKDDIDFQLQKQEMKTDLKLANQMSFVHDRLRCLETRLDNPPVNHVTVIKRSFIPARVFWTCLDVCCVVLIATLTVDICVSTVRTIGK
jgi:hypothetical protein